MPTQMDKVIQHLRNTVLRHNEGLTDGQLLGHFIEHSDPDAVTALVRRHGAMVWGVCRRVLGNDHDADDAFQATFLVLVRKASSVRQREMVGNWLYGVAHQTARKAVAMRAKRQTREKQVKELPETASPPQTPWDDLQPLLDQELSLLPDIYRIAIVLCDLEGNTRKEVAQQLGLPEGTLAGRLARGRALLAKRLARHGLAVSAGALAGMLSQQAASASVPAAVMIPTIEAMASVAAGQAVPAGLISAKAAALMEGVLKTMLLTKLLTTIKVAMALLFVASAVALSWGVSAGQQQAGAPEEKSQQKPADLKKDQDATLRAAGAQVEAAKAAVLLAEANLKVALQLHENLKEASNKDEHLNSDKEKLQGTWRLESMAEGGEEVPFPDNPTPEEEAQMLSVIVGDEWATAYFKGKKGFTFTLDPAKKPKTIDLHPLQDATETTLGIYELNGDELRICCSAAELLNRKPPERPVTFTTKKGSYTMLLTLKRQKQAAGKKDEKPKADKERLQGTWKLFSEVADGKIVKDGAIKDGSCTIKGTSLRLNTTIIKEIFRFKLDETTEPKLIDLVAWDAGIGAADEPCVRCIYSIVGDTLKICVKSNANGRPTTLESKAGSNHLLWTFKRESPTDEPKKDAKNNDDRFPNGRHHDFGKVNPSATLNYDFGFVNTSRVPLQLAVSVSAACVSGRVNKQVLQPGEKGTLEITVDARRFTGSKTMLLFLTTESRNGVERFVFSVTADSDHGERPIQGDFPLGP